MSRAQRIALLLGTVLLLGGLVGILEVGSYWSTAGCPSSDVHGCSHPAPLSPKNSTIVIVGMVISTGVVVLGGLIVFLAAYLPAPTPSLSRTIAVEDAIRQGKPSAPAAGDPTTGRE